MKCRQAWPSSPTSPLELAGGDSGSDTSSIAGDCQLAAGTRLKDASRSPDSTNAVSWSQPPAITGPRKAPTVRCRAIRQPAAAHTLPPPAQTGTIRATHPVPTASPAATACQGRLSPFPGMAAPCCSSDVIIPPPPPPPRLSQPGSQVPLAAAMLALEAPGPSSSSTTEDSRGSMPHLPLELLSPRAAACSSKWQSAGPLFSWDPASPALGRNIWRNAPGVSMPFGEWGNEDTSCSLPARRGSY